EDATASPPILKRDGARATIRLNRPRHLNRLQPEDLDVLLKLFAELEADPAIRVLVLTGTGRAFSAGYDLGSNASCTETDEEKTAGSAFEIVVDRLEDLRLPTICLWRSDRPGAGLRFPDRRRGLRDVHAGGTARTALLQERHQTLCVAARRRQRQKAV